MIILRVVKVNTSCTNVEQSLFKQIMTGDKFALVHHYCVEVAMFVHHRVLWPSIFWIFIVWWIEKLCNQQHSLVGDWSCVLGSAQLVSHVLGAVHYKERLLLQNKSNWILGQGFNCRLVKGTRIPLLITACFDNSGFSEVVTLKLTGGIFAVLVFSFVNKSPCQFNFYCT